MIWKPCTLYEPEETGQDVLGNPIIEPKEVLQTYVRFTPWTDEQRFALPVPFQAVVNCYMAEIDGVKQEITAKINLCPRYTVIQVKAYKE